MKISLLATTLIVGTTAVLAWFQNERATDVRRNYEVLVDQAATLGLPVDGDGAGPGAKSGPGSKSASGGRDGGQSREEARAMAAELFAFTTKAQESAMNGGSPPAGANAFMAQFIERFSGLDPAVLAHLIDEIRETDQLDAKAKQEILWYCFHGLGQRQPETALNLYLHAKDLLAKGEDCQVLLMMAISRLTKEDPRKALEWLELNGKELPEGMLRQSRDAAKAKVLDSDPDLMMQELEKLDPQKGAEFIIETAMRSQDPARQLELLRGYNESRSPEGEENRWSNTVTSSILRALGRTISRQTFASATSFMEEAQFTEEERTAIASGIGFGGRDLPDLGQWIPWVHENVRPGDRERYVDRLVRRWTTSDFRAAAAWIGEQPTGPLRDQATRQFARTVAPHDPASAARWALTLPESGERTELLKEVHQSWKAKDEDAAAAFAAEQGIEE